MKDSLQGKCKQISKGGEKMDKEDNEIFKVLREENKKLIAKLIANGFTKKEVDYMRAKLRDMLVKLKLSS